MPRCSTFLALALMATLCFTLPPSALAQDQFDAPSWTLGWSTDMDKGYTVDLDDDWDIDGEIVAYVENTRMSQVELDLTYDVNTWVPFTLDGPDTITVGAGENKSFTIKLATDNDVDVREYNPDNTSTLTVMADEKVGDTSTGTQEVEGNIYVPKMFNLRPEVTLSNDDLYAGSSVEISIQMLNLGNANDAVKDASAQVRSCPHLTVDGLDALENTVVQPTDARNGQDAFSTLTLVASESQPRRTCEITISLVSEGDDVARSTTFDVEVFAFEGDEKPTTDPGNGGSDEGQDEGLSVESNTLPGFLAFEAISILAAGTALFRKKTED